jgi:hypothetical protein
MLEGHDRRTDRNLALALDRHPVGARPPPVAACLDLARELDRPAEQQILGQRVLSASGCDMIANVRRRAISSLRLVINSLQLLLGSGRRSATAPLATDMMASRLFANCGRPFQLQPHRE